MSNQNVSNQNISNQSMSNQIHIIIMKQFLIQEYGPYQILGIPEI